MNRLYRLSVLMALQLSMALAAPISRADLDSFEPGDRGAGEVRGPIQPICMSVDYKVLSIQTEWVGNGTQITARISRGSRFPGSAPSAEVDLYDHNQYRGTLQTGPMTGRAMTKDVIFFVPYNIFQPDAYLRVIVDPRDRVKECNENNNSLDYSVIG